MATIRVAKKKEFPYIQIDKFVIDKDDRISWAAKGVMTYLIGKPDDWEVNVKDLIKRASNGRDAVYGIINELIDAGYIEREQARGSSGDGKFGDITYLVHETPLHQNPLPKVDKRKKKSPSEPVPDNPDTGKLAVKTPVPDNPDTAKPVDNPPFTEKPDTGNSDTGLPDTGKPEHSNKELSNNDFSKKEEEDSTTHLPGAIDAKLIQQDINRVENLYPQYAKITEQIAAEAIKNRRPISPEEEFFLEQAAAVPVHEKTLEDIYLTIQGELGRSARSVPSFELIESVFQKFSQNVKRGNIKFDQASWFKTTWFNERISEEQSALIK